MAKPGYYTVPNRQDISNLETQTRANYNAAINYYAQKKMMFLKLAATEEQKQDAKFLENYANAIENATNNTINNNWSAIVNEVLNAVTFLQGGKYGNNSYVTGFKYTVDQTKLVNVPDWMKKEIIAGQRNQNFYSLMGFNYEKYLEQAVIDIGKELAVKGYNSAISAFKGSGTKKTISAMRNDFVNIRADLAIGLGKSAGKDMVLMSADGSLAAELQQEFKLEKFISKEQQEVELINKYLQSGMFGLNVKLWTMGHNKKFTESSGIASALNQAFAEGPKDHTWDITYASAMANKVVSSYLLDVVGPTTIALVSGGGFTWMDSFLGGSLFTMGIQPAKNKTYLNRGTWHEIYPEVHGTSIYLKNYNMSKAIAEEKAIISSTNRTRDKEGTPYRVTMRLNRLR